MSKKISKQHKRFCDEYLKDLNAKQAAIRAGYSQKTAAQHASRLLTNVNLQEYIQKRMADREKRTEITQDMVLREYARIAFLDPANLFDDEGNPLPISAIDEDTRRAIAGVEVCSRGNGEMGIGEVLKLRLSDKKGALDSVARHLGMFNDKLDLGITSDLADKIARARARVIKR